MLRLRQLTVPNTRSKNKLSIRSRFSRSKAETNVATRSFVSSENPSLVNNVNVIFLILSIFVCVCVCVFFFFNCLFIKCLFWFLFIYRSVCECGNGEEVFGGEGVSEIGEEAIFGGVRLYVHTGVQRSENFPGISALRSIYDGIPMEVKDNLQTVYFVHPDLQARLFFATFGRFLFTGG